MNTYQKYKPAWLQLVIFMSLTFGIFLALSFIALFIIAKIYNLNPLQLAKPDLSDPAVVAASKLVQAVSTIAFFLVPSLVDGMVLVAPSLAPGEEKIYKIAYPIELPAFKWAVPRMLISANAEKLSHRKELTKMLPRWKELTIPVIYVQGENDGLIYPSNAAFARRALVNASCLTIEMIPDRGHLIMFSEIKRIKESIVDMTILATQFSSARMQPK